MEKRWRCLICGYIHTGPIPPEACPVCGAPASDFEPLPNADSAPKADNVPNADPAPARTLQPDSWKCLNCAYEAEGAEPPEACPVCGAKQEAFLPSGHLLKPDGHPGRIKVAILGGGIAGVTAAEELRRELPDADITIVSAERRMPIYRLNLSRYLAGEIGRDQLPIHSMNWYEDMRITLITDATATEIDVAGKRLRLGNGPDIPYDVLVLAAGAHPFIPPVAGATLPNVFTIRDAEDADLLLERLSAAGAKARCVCIGGGILGLELAGALAARKVPVMVLENSEWLMPRQLNRRGAEILKRHLQRIGVEVREQSKTREIIGTDCCSGVLLESGETLPASIVMIAAGVRPNTWLARKAGLEVNQGVTVDSCMRTSRSDIYAVGDVCEHFGQVYGLWAPAMYQGRIAAMNISGTEAHFGGLPRSNVLKVLGLDLFSIGIIQPPDGSHEPFEWEEEDRYAMVMVHDGRISGGIVLGDKALAASMKRAMEAGLQLPRTTGPSDEGRAGTAAELIRFIRSA